ncbi:MAG TPA: hypothetical protein DGC76_07005, partial [Candidatus Accumulibacter sp.]|nr:hypothetical protein [Accumulibacter sp.]
ASGEVLGLGGPPLQIQFNVSSTPFADKAAAASGRRSPPPGERRKAAAAPPRAKPGPDARAQARRKIPGDRS